MSFILQSNDYKEETSRVKVKVKRKLQTHLFNIAYAT